jgi:hypothetical protein
MTVSVACTTIGARVPQLIQMIGSVPADVPVAICWQGGTPPPELERLSGTRPLVVTTSEPGISAGRNAAAETALRAWSPDALLFPNDDSLYPPGFFPALAEILGSDRPDVLALPVLRRAGTAGWKPRGGLDPLLVAGTTVRDVLRGSHEPGLVIAADAFRRTGGFDHRLGVGADGPWQSGEGPDLVFRIRAQGGSTVGSRHPVVLENRTAEDPARAAAKATRYAPGVAYVAVRHGGLRAASVPLAGMAVRMLCPPDPRATRALLAAVTAGLCARRGGDQEAGPRPTGRRLTADEMAARPSMQRRRSTPSR